VCFIILSVERNNIKIDDIRKLKAVLFQSSIDNNPRYIILDDVELYNINSLNALLKIIEEPTHNNHFILINSQEKEIPQTIRSRCIETKFFIFNDGKNKIIKSLLNKYDIETIFDYTNMSITPGNFLHFNQALIDNDIDINNSYDNNIMKLLSLHKKTKNMVFIKLSIFLTDQYFYDMSKKHNKKTDYFNNLRITIIKSINDFVTYNLNINLVINSINEQLNYER
jgi:DNA polymerase-3 subunit delta'